VRLARGCEYCTMVAAHSEKVGHSAGDKPPDGRAFDVRRDRHHIVGSAVAISALGLAELRKPSCSLAMLGENCGTGPAPHREAGRKPVGRCARTRITMAAARFWTRADREGRRWPTALSDRALGRPTS